MLAQTFLSRQLTPFLSGGGSSVIVPTTAFPGIYSPALTCVESPILLTNADDNVEMLFRVTATDEDGAVVDWTDEDNYGVASATLWVVSINADSPVFANAVFIRSIDSGNITPTATALKIEYAFTAADIVLMPLFIYYVFVEVVLSNGEERTAGRVRIEMN